MSYLNQLWGLAEEGGLCGEEGDVFALLVQTAVAAAHAVAARHLGVKYEPSAAYRHPAEPQEEF